MNATTAAATRGHSRTWIIATLGALALLALWFIGKRDYLGVQSKRPPAA